MRAETPLQAAERHVVQAELAIGRQRAIIEYMERHEQNTQSAQALLRTMEFSLQMMYHRLKHERERIHIFETGQTNI